MTDEARMVRAGLALNDELMFMLMLVIESEARHSLPAVAGRVRPNGGHGAKSTEQRAGSWPDYRTTGRQDYGKAERGAKGNI
jgi:hypothetical protein